MWNLSVQGRDMLPPLSHGIQLRPLVPQDQNLKSLRYGFWFVCMYVCECIWFDHQLLITDYQTTLLSARYLWYQILSMFTPQKRLNPTSQASWRALLSPASSTEVYRVSTSQDITERSVSEKGLGCFWKPGLGGRQNLPLTVITLNG